MKKLLAVLAVALAAPLTANAVVIENDLMVDQRRTFVQVLMPGDEIEWKFNALDSILIRSFALAGTGNNGGTDLANVRFGFSMPPTNGFDDIEVDGDSAEGGGFLPGVSVLSGGMFSIFVTDSIQDDVGLSLSFTTHPIPVPAAGLLLGTVLLGGGLYARRKA